MKSASITKLTAESYRAHLEVIAYDVYLQLDAIFKDKARALTADDRATLFAALVAQQAEEGGCLPKRSRPQ